MTTETLAEQPQYYVCIYFLYIFLSYHGHILLYDVYTFSRKLFCFLTGLFVSSHILKKGKLLSATTVKAHERPGKRKKQLSWGCIYTCIVSEHGFKDVYICPWSPNYVFWTYIYVHGCWITFFGHIYTSVALKKLIGRRCKIWPPKVHLCSKWKLWCNTSSIPNTAFQSV